MNTVGWGGGASSLTSWFGLPNEIQNRKRRHPSRPVFHDPAAVPAHAAPMLSYSEAKMPES